MSDIRICRPYNVCLYTPSARWVYIISWSLHVLRRHHHRLLVHPLPLPRIPVFGLSHLSLYCS
ncbi:hypothetical protein EVA_10107 [gut metagenome]|uniref:Uncharacterized protein n=1 Tax=gut metagenome TaxID=749906 RepID=J9CNU2_9ZZZZ